MRVSDAEDLFTKVEVGDEVQLVGERNEQIAKLLPETPIAAASDSKGGDRWTSQSLR